MWLARVSLILASFSAAQHSSVLPETCDQKVSKNFQKDNVLLQVGQMQTSKGAKQAFDEAMDAIETIPSGMLKERRPGRPPPGMLKEKRPGGSPSGTLKERKSGMKAKPSQNKNDDKTEKTNDKTETTDAAEEDEEDEEDDTADEADEEPNPQVAQVIMNLKEAEGAFFAMMSAKASEENLSQFNKLLYFSNAQLFRAMSALEKCQGLGLLQNGIPKGMLKERRRGPPPGMLKERKPGKSRRKKKDRKRNKKDRKKNKGRKKDRKKKDRKTKKEKRKNKRRDRKKRKQDARAKAAAEAEVETLNKQKRKEFAGMMRELKQTEPRPFKNENEPYNEVRMNLVQAIEKIGGAKPSLFLGFADHAWNLVQEAAGHLMTAEKLLTGDNTELGGDIEEGSFEWMFQYDDEDEDEDEDEDDDEDSTSLSTAASSSSD